MGEIKKEDIIGVNYNLLWDIGLSYDKDREKVILGLTREIDNLIDESLEDERKFISVNSMYLVGIASKENLAKTYERFETTKKKTQTANRTLEFYRKFGSYAIEWAGEQIKMECDLEKALGGVNL